MRAIELPPSPDEVEFVAGIDGFPAFKLLPEARVKAPYLLYGPEHLFEDFSILVTIKLDGPLDMGYLFAITTPSDNVIQLGLAIESMGPLHSITLVYTDFRSGDESQPGRKLATFSVPDLLDRWLRLSLKIENNNVTFYKDCVESGLLVLPREPKILPFDPASTLHLFGSGPLLGGYISVSSLKYIFHLIRYDSASKSTVHVSFNIPWQRVGHSHYGSVCV